MSERRTTAHAAEIQKSAMPIRYRIDSSLNAVFTTASGLVADDDIVKHVRTVTTDSLLRGEARDEVFNPQMIIDWPVTEITGAKTFFTISKPVLQRLIDGRTLGIAVTPLGSINASFSTRDVGEPRLLFNIEE